MNRRDFLTLLASAPIAALAPLPKVLAQPRLLFHRNAFAMAMAPLYPSEFFDAWRLAMAARYPVDVIYGRGYVSTMNPNGTIDIHSIGD